MASALRLHDDDALVRGEGVEGEVWSGRGASSPAPSTWFPALGSAASNAASVSAGSGFTAHVAAYTEGGA